MSTLLELIDRKNQRLEDIPEAFQSNVERLQKRIYNKITELIGQLETEKGQIVMSEANLLRVQQINDELKKVLHSTEYINAVRKFTGEFSKQKAINDDYFKKAFGNSFSSPALADQLVRNSQRDAFELLAGQAAEQNFIVPIKAQLDRAVSSGASYAETVKGIRTLVEGDEDIDGNLLRYSKQISWDAFALSDRAYTNATADEVEIEWYLYSGGIVEDSRCFCVERDRQYFHYKEIEAFGNGEDLGECNTGDGEWQGQMKGTNSATIFIVAGGYNCRHTWSPVSISVVPKDVILRNLYNGNYRMSSFESREFGIPMMDSLDIHSKGGTIDEDRKELHDSILKDIQKGVSPVKKPTVYMMGGGPASGKSSISLPSKKISNIATIDPDAIKIQLPEYKDMIKDKDPYASTYVHEESSLLSKKALKEAIDKKQNAFLDGTGDGSYTNLEKKITQMKSNGAKVVADYVTMDTDRAWQIQIKRGEETGRYVEESYFRETHRNISIVVPRAIEDNLYDEFRLWDTNIKGKPILVAEVKDKKFIIYNEILWQNFLNKGI